MEIEKVMPLFLFLDDWTCVHLSDIAGDLRKPVDKCVRMGCVNIVFPEALDDSFIGRFHKKVNQPEFMNVVYGCRFELEKNYRIKLFQPDGAEYNVISMGISNSYAASVMVLSILIRECIDLIGEPDFSPMPAIVIDRAVIDEGTADRIFPMLCDICKTEFHTVQRDGIYKI